MNQKMKRFKWLVKQIKKNGYKIGAEIGTGKGNTGKFLLNKCTDLYLYQIAWYPDNGFPDSSQEAKRMWEARIKPYMRRVTVIEAPSSEAHEQVNNNLDFIFIDADHSYESCLQDIQLWFPKVKSGGLVSGHDYGHPRFPGVEKAVKEYFGTNYKYNKECDWIWFHLKD